MPQDFLNRLADHARTRPDHQAVRQLAADGAPVRSLTYAQLVAAAARAAAALSARFAPGDTVILQGSNSAATVVAALAGMAAGLTLFPAYAHLTDDELRRALANSGAKAVVRPDREALELEGAPGRECPWAPSSSNAALLNQSAGTTGQPKIVFRDAAAIDAGAALAALATRITGDDVVLGVAPLCHAFGQEHLMLGPLTAGATVLLCPGFDREVTLSLLTRGEVTLLPGVPFMYEVLAQAPTPQRFPSLRLAFASGAPLPRPVYDAMLERYGITLGQLYGTSETVSTAFNHPTDAGFDPMAVGRPLPGVSIRIVDLDDPRRALPPGTEGHVAVRTPAMLTRYLGETASPLVDEHFLTGDLGRIDPHGALHLTGRLKLLIDIGGLKVNPLEVEAIMAEHPAVRECVILPLPVSQTLVRLKALVTLRPGVATVDPEDLRAFARARLSHYKVPRVFEVRPSFPKTPSGKIQRQLLSAES